MKIGIPCSCLIDQNRFIGEDPVGHCCMNQAVFRYEKEDGQETFFCKSCYELFLEDSFRITVQFSPIGQTESRIKKILSEMLSKDWGEQ